MKAKGNRLIATRKRAKQSGEARAEAKRARKVRREGEVMRAMDLPEGTAPRFPCFRLLGDAHLEVENHKGVLEFGDSLVRLYTEIGILRVTGERLEIRNADRESVLIDGVIASVEYEKREQG